MEHLLLGEPSEREVERGLADRAQLEEDAAEIGDGLARPRLQRLAVDEEDGRRFSARG